MTTVKIIRSGGEIISVDCDGHTGYGVEGEDIVCAALSSVVQTALLGLMVVGGINVIFERDDDKGKLKLELPKIMSSEQRKTASIILETMLCGVSDLYEGFSDFIELII